MFSVVIPLYNKELSVKNTIQSVLDQTFQEFEIVIVNDGSTDDSVTVVESFNDSRIRLIHQKNQGVSAARNRGIEEAKYEWICFLDADDLWKDNHLEEIVKMMKSYPDEKVFVTSFEYSSGRKMMGDPNQSEIYKINNFFTEYLKFKNLMWTSTVVIHKTCVQKSGMFNEKLSLGEDIDLWGRLSKIFSIIKSNKVTAIYRDEAENRSNAGSYNMKKSFLSYLDFSKMNSKEEKRFFAFWVWHKLKRLYVNKDFKNVFYLLSKYGLNVIRYK